MIQSYSNILKNFAIIILVIFCLVLQNRNTNLNEKRIEDIRHERKVYEKTVRNKEREIKRLRKLINRETTLIDESIDILNELQQEKRDIETVYVEKVRIINSYDAKQLKKYFDEELN